MNFVSPSSLFTSVRNENARQSIEVFPDTPITREFERSGEMTNRDLQRYREAVMESVKTLFSLSAMEQMATENVGKGVGSDVQRRRTQEEADEDRKTYVALKDCQVMTSEVFIPLVMADLHHLTQVYIDYRKRMLLEL